MADGFMVSNARDKDINTTHATLAGLPIFPARDGECLWLVRRTTPPLSLYKAETVDRRSF